MNKVGIDLSTTSTTKLTIDLAQGAKVLITMGCGDQCRVVPGGKRDDWPLEDPKDKSLVRVREIRDEIRERVKRSSTAKSAVGAKRVNLGLTEFI